MELSLVFLVKSLTVCWFIIDNQLKGVIPLEPLINFELLNQKGLLSVKFSQPHNPLTLTVDFQYPFNNSWPRHFHAVDNNGKETIISSQER